MAVTTALNNVITNLVTALTNDSNIGGAGVTVWDGPVITGDNPVDWITIGHDGNEDGDMTVGDWVNSYMPIGARRMDEEGSVKNVLVVNSGDMENPNEARNAGLNLLGHVDSVIRADPTLAGACIYAGLSAHSLEYKQTANGFGCKINFEVKYKART